MTTSRTLPDAGAISSPQACAACGEPITTIRSPGSTESFPPGKLNVSPRMIPATRESSGTGMSRSGTPRTRGSAVSSTSNSTSCTCPSAKTSVCRAAGTAIVRTTAWAVSTSDETMKSTSSWPSCHTSRYSGLVVRTIVVTRGAIALQIIAETMFDSSRDVQAISRSQPATPAAASTRRLAPFPSTVEMS